MVLRRKAGPFLVALALLTFAARAGAEQGKALTEEALSGLIDQQVPDDFIVKKIEKTGVGFTVDAAALERLQKAGASKGVLAALQQAGQPANAVTYQGILKILRSGGNEAGVLRRIQSSPTTLVLDDEQIAALKKAGATQRVLDELQRNRNPVSVGSDITDFAVVLDCSGSMNDKTPDGVSKMDAAKKVVAKFIRDLPNSKRLSFVVYGTEPTKYKCEDVHVVQPLGPLSDDVKDALEKYIGGLEPAGWTPLARGMMVAGKELSKAKGLCQLIVVTDGMETCKGDPGAVADDLTKNLNLPGGVDVIGFGVAPDEKAALYALEKKGKFNLYKAEEGLKDLQAKVKEAQDRAEREAKKRAEELAAREEADRQARKDKEDQEAKARAERAERDAKAKADAERLARKEKEDKDRENAASKDDFPGGETTKWDVRIIEDNPSHLRLIKRVVKEDQISWTVEVKSDKAAEALHQFEHPFDARFLDSDGVQIIRVKTAINTREVGRGDNVRFELKLPKPDILKKTAKVEIVPSYKSTEAIRP